MQFTVAALSTIALAGSAFVQAQTVTQSKPFNLTVTSESGYKYKDTPLVACHSGAAIESLCLFNNEASTFNLNTTSGATSQVKGDSPGGILTWYLPAQPIGESEAMGFYTPASTNVAQLMFGIGNTQQVSFDDNDEMNIIAFYDDTVTPPTYATTNVAQYRWQMCETNFEGYQYTTLNWIYGPSKPANPSCEAVSVKRVFTY